MAKIWWIFVQLYKNSADCFVLEVSTVSTVSRFQVRICVASQEKENEILFTTNEEIGAAIIWLSITQNPKRNKTILRIKHKIYSRQWELESSIFFLCFFEYSSYPESPVLVNFQFFPSNLSNIFQKYILEELSFFFFLFINCGGIRNI